ncbi:DUF488 family protein [Coralloluteibacterium thermophilus]|uniref:DUF488 family protein n=1 Tax=Coralloluteibacterium thermophilum TaxID=2707049 RepID=A0ABV9NJ68_9GAMM
MKDLPSPPADTIWTVGHSVLAIEAFVALLQGAGIVRLADVRRYPGSRRHPQFGADALAQALAAAGIEYLPMPALGGRRPPRPDSPNTAWRNAGFRGYADYMQTPAYASARDALLAAAVRPTAIMCAETLWWQCHRGLIADDLKLRGIRVLHLRPGAAASEHPWTAAARVVDGALSYAAPEPVQRGLF